MLNRKGVPWLTSRFLFLFWANTVIASGLPQSGSCLASEAWGESKYLLNRDSGIHHYVRHRNMTTFQLARVIPETQAASLCIALERGLVFVIEGDGIYQIERHMDGSGERIWLRDIPAHFGLESYFAKTDRGLALKSGSNSTPIIADTTVRNDVLPELQAQIETSFDGNDIRQSLGLSPATKATISKLDHGVLTVQLNSLPVAIEEKEIVGHCAEGQNIVSFDGNGTLYRYRQGADSEAIELDGQFYLGSGAKYCEINRSSERLYVVNSGSVIWVFNLQESGLRMPRAVTTDRVVDSLNGITLYGEEYVITQSKGDASFLVFEASTMLLVAQFRVVPDVLNGIDGVRVSPAFTAITSPIGNMQQGLLAIRDNQNRLPDGEENIKLIDWRVIQQLIDTTQLSKRN